MRSRALLLAAAAVVALGAAAVWLSRTVPPVAAEFRVRGLAGEVRVVRDRHAVPHVFAANPADAFFALGFVHAQDRLWQMELQRRLAAGRLAEIVGDRALASDRLARLFGFVGLAEAGYAALAPEVRGALEAYAAGVNAWLAAAPALPPEFALLRFAPEPWRPTDGLAMLRAMGALMSYNVREKLLRARAALGLDGAQLADLFPGVGAAGTTLGAAESLADPLAAAAGALDGIGPAGASNVWALAGTRTATGRPILANDPHTALGAPALWYLARLEAPGLSVVGATVPGLPFVLLGQNGRIAWGMTSSGFDVEDLFVERVDGADPARYIGPDGPLPFAVRHETIRVAGGADEDLLVRATRHGPVLSDVGPRAAALAGAGAVIALAYGGLVADDRTAEALYRINRAARWTDFVAAARLWVTPAQNLTMAGVDGTIGMISAGLVPQRGRGERDALRPGWRAEFDWTGVVAFADLPQVVDPQGGAIVNANDAVVPPGDRRYLGDPPDEGLRAARIRALLAQAAPQRVEDSLAVQRDVLAADAEVLLPLLLRAAPRGSRAAAALALLRGWDREMRRGRPEPLIYVGWLRELMRALFERPLGAVFADYWEPRPRALARIMDGDSPWCAAAGGTCAVVAADALSRALDDLAARYGPDPATWRWGAAHGALLSHLVWSHVPLVGRIADLSLPVDGGNFTVGRAAADFALDDAPYGAGFGPAFRAVYDLADPSRHDCTRSP
jgi:penicillin amidase